MKNLLQIFLFYPSTFYLKYIQTFYAFCRAVWDNLGGGTGKLPELEVSGKVGFFGKNAQEQAEKIEAPVGGSVVDAEARAAIVQIAQVLEHFGLTKEK